MPASSGERSQGSFGQSFRPADDDMAGRTRQQSEPRGPRNGTDQNVKRCEYGKDWQRKPCDLQGQIRDAIEIGRKLQRDELRGAKHVIDHASNPVGGFSIDHPQKPSVRAMTPAMP